MGYGNRPIPSRGNRKPATKNARTYHNAFLSSRLGPDKTSDFIVQSKEYKMVKQSERSGISFREAGRELGISLDNFRESTRLSDEN